MSAPQPSPSYGTNSPLVYPPYYGVGEMEIAKFVVNGGTVGLNLASQGTIVGTANGLPTTLTTLIAGEDLTNNVLKTEERFSYFHYVGGTASTAGTIKSAAGFLHTLDFGQHTSGGTYTLYDSIGTSSTVIAVISPGANLPPTKLYDISFATGLTIVSGSVCDLTFSYR